VVKEQQNPLIRGQRFEFPDTLLRQDKKSSRKAAKPQSRKKNGQTIFKRDKKRGLPRNSRGKTAYGKSNISVSYVGQP
jgi:hypothetical protein